VPEQPAYLVALEQFRKSLLTRERASAVRMVNAYGDIYSKLQEQITALLDQIATLDEPSKEQVLRLARYKTLRRQVIEQLDRYGVIADNELMTGAREAIRAAGVEARALTEASLPGVKAIDSRIMATWNRLPDAAVETMIGFLQDDAPLRQGLRTQLGTAVADAVEKELVNAVALGRNPRQTAAVLRKQLGQGLTWSLRTARTAQIYAYREATRANYAANSQVVRGWYWRSAQIPGRTCLSCLAMDDGTVHPVTETLNDHDNGLCYMLPCPVSYKELGLDISDPVRNVQTGEQWFRSLPEAKQRAIMGKGKYEAWQEGKFEFKQLSRTQPHSVWGEVRSETPLKELVAA
jgi:hypothetical protein